LCGLFNILAALLPSRRSFFAPKTKTLSKRL